MRLVSYRAILWSAIAALVGTLAVNLLIGPQVWRVPLTLAVITPVVWLTTRTQMFLRARPWVVRERRRNLTLREATNQFLINVRNLNRLKVIAQAAEDLEDAEDMIEEVVAQMHRLVERIREEAGPKRPKSFGPEDAK